MANKALAKRQKMTIQTEPSRKAPRNPSAAPAGRPGAGARRGGALQQSLLQRLLATKKV